VAAGGFTQAPAGGGGVQKRERPISPGRPGGRAVRGA
jgi:hypothetical protein